MNERKTKGNECEWIWVNINMSEFKYDLLFIKFTFSFLDLFFISSLLWFTNFLHFLLTFLTFFIIDKLWVHSVCPVWLHSIWIWENSGQNMFLLWHRVRSTPNERTPYMNFNLFIWILVINVFLCAVYFLLCFNVFFLFCFSFFFLFFYLSFISFSNLIFLLLGHPNTDGTWPMVRQSSQPRGRRWLANLGSIGKYYFTRHWPKEYETYCQVIGYRYHLYKEESSIPRIHRYVTWSNGREMSRENCHVWDVNVTEGV